MCAVPVCMSLVAYVVCFFYVLCFFKQKTAYEMRISDWSSDVCSSDLAARQHADVGAGGGNRAERVARQHRDRNRHVLQAFLAALRGHDDVAEPAVFDGGTDGCVLRGGGCGPDRSGESKAYSGSGRKVAHGELPETELTMGERKTQSEEHTSELQSLMRNSYAGFCLKKKKN